MITVERVWEKNRMNYSNSVAVIGALFPFIRTRIFWLSWHKGFQMIPWCMWGLELFQGWWAPGGAAVVCLIQNKQRALQVRLWAWVSSPHCDNPKGNCFSHSRCEVQQVHLLCGASTLMKSCWPSTSAFRVQLFRSTVVAQKLGVGWMNLLKHNKQFSGMTSADLISWA